MQKIRDLIVEKIDDFIILFFISFFLVKSFFLIYPDLNLSYPFLTPDSYDWIANGLFYSGYNVYSSFRAPGLPLVIAFFEKLDILNLLPLLNQLLMAGIFISIFKLIHTHFSKTTSFLTLLIIFFNFFIQNIGLYVLADIYAVFFILLGFLFYTRGSSKKNYIAASLFWALSFIFQYALLYFIPAIILHFIFFRRKTDLNNLLLSIIPFFSIIVPWFIYKEIKFGSIVYAGNAQAEYLRIHSDSMFFYLFNTMSVFGVLLFITIIIGLVLTAFIENRGKLLFLYSSGLIIITWVIFWVFIYDGNDKRFIIYLFFFLIPFVSVAVEYFLRLFKDVNQFGRIILVLLFLAVISNTYISYESPFVNHILKFTNNIGIKFDPFLNRKYYNINLDKTSLGLIRTEKGFNSINFHDLSKSGQKKVYNKTKKQLEYIAQKIDIKNTDICISYAEVDTHRIYVERNKFSNFFKEKVKINGDNCNIPNVYVEGDVFQFDN